MAVWYGGLSCCHAFCLYILTFKENKGSLLKIQMFKGLLFDPMDVQEAYGLIWLAVMILQVLLSGCELED